MGILSSLGRLFESTEARDLRRARQVLAREQAELKSAQLRRQRRLIADIPETVGYPQSDWFQPFFDRLSEYQTDPNFYPFGNPSLRKNGNNWPLFQNEQQLDVYRQLSRNVYDGNSHGKGLLTGLRNYVVWKGFTLRATAKKKAQSKDVAVSAIVDRVQLWIDNFIELNDFDEIQQEAFVRSKRDGEYFWRHFPRSDGQTVIRFVWPEHVRQPQGEDQSEWSYGIRCNHGDIETPLQYSLIDPENISREPELVGADEIDHVKCNVDRGIKRGMPELCLDMRDILEMSRRLRRNMAEGAAIQAAIAYIRKHGSATASQVNDFAAGQRDYQRPRVTIEGDTTRDTEFFESGTILDVDSGQDYIAPPGAENIPGYVEVIQACLRAAGSRWNAPEGLASGDYSNANFASALVAEAPFRRCCETEQAFYERRFRRTVVKAMWHAIAIGALPRDTFAVVEIQVEAPTLEVRNRLEEMQVHQGYNAMGILSPQTITQKIGEDWENEQGNLDAASVRRGPEGSALPLPGEQHQNDPGAELFGTLEQWLFEDKTQGLIKKTITNKAGKKQVVWVKPGQDAPAPDSKKKQQSNSKPRTQEGYVSDVAQRAKDNHKMVDKQIQRYAEEHNEPAFAKAVGGISFPNGEPIDVAIAGPEGTVAHGIELKTMVDNSRKKIDMNRYAQVRKIEWERSQGAAFHTVVIDDHDVYDANGEGQHDTSKRKLYYRRGVGSFRVEGMHPVKDLAELKALMEMEDSQLPKAAQRTDQGNRVGRWRFFTDEKGKGYRNTKTGEVVRPKK